jgi:hypothetical protein
MRTGTNMVPVHYRGGAPAVADLIGGQLQVMVGIVAECIEYIKAGKLRALAVASLTPSDVLPNLPTLAEYLPGFEALFWTGVCAPRHTPSEVIAKLNSEINAAISDPRIDAMGPLPDARCSGGIIGISRSKFGCLTATGDHAAHTGHLVGRAWRDLVPAPGYVAIGADED